MGIFRKEGDIIDITLLQKRGIIKNLNNENPKKEESKDFIDLTNLDKPAQQQIENPSPLSFFDSISSSPELQKQNPESSPELAHLKVKLDDFEYKLDRFLERIEKLEEKILDFERNASNIR